MRSDNVEFGAFRRVFGGREAKQSQPYAIFCSKRPIEAGWLGARDHVWRRVRRKNPTDDKK